MAIYQIEGPDGGVFEIEGPENATEEQLQQAAYDYYMGEQQQLAEQRRASTADVPMVGAEPAPTAPDLFSGQTLQFGPLDTGVQISPEVTQFLAGAGGRLADVPLALQSIRERLALGGDAAAISAEVERKRQIDEAIKATTAGQLGGIAGDIAVGLPFGGAGLARAAAGGAAMELTKPLTAEESYLEAAGKGAATGAIVQGALSGLAKAGRLVSNRFSEEAASEAAKNYQRLSKEGLEPDLSQIFESPFLDSVKSRLHALPFTANKQAKIAVDQMKKFNQRVLKVAGINADIATPEVIDKGFNALGKRFDDLIKNTDKVKIDQKALDEIAKIAQDAPNQVGTENAALILRQVDDIQNKIGAGDIITGEAYKALRTNLNNLGTAWRKSRDRAEASPFVGKLVSTLDNAVGDSFGPARQEAWKKARSEYAALSTLANSNAIDEFGMINGNKLFTAVRNSDKKAFARGKRGELANVARLGKQMQTKIPDSGTAGNTAMQNLLTGRAVSPLTQETDTMINSVLRAGEGWVLSKSAQGLFNSPMLRDILLNRTPVQRSVIDTIKTIERQAEVSLSPKVRQGLARTIREIQRSQVAQGVPARVGTAAALDYMNPQAQPQ
jgi:hypothetical protein